MTVEICTTATELGEWMLSSALKSWYDYDDNQTFTDSFTAGTYTIVDPDMDKTLDITPKEFFEAHKRLIWNGEMDNESKGAHRDYWGWASRDNDSAPDEYDDWTCDSVLQILLYGEIIYG